MVVVIVLFQSDITHKIRFTLVNYFKLILNELIMYLQISFLIYLNLIFLNLHRLNIIFHLHFLLISNFLVLFIFFPPLLTIFINIIIFKSLVIFFLVHSILKI